MAEESLCYPNQSQIHDFPKEGARFRVKCHVDAIQWGGVVADIFRGLKKAYSVGGGGGGVAEIFRGLKKPMRFSGGGGSNTHFSSSQKKKKYAIRWGGVVAQKLSFP